MFIDIDYTKRPKKAKFYLAKPNKKIISHIYEKFDDKLSLKLGNINELNFSIPYFVEENGRMIENRHIELIKEKMLIKVVYGNSYKEWYIVDEIEESGNDKDIFNIKAFSLGYELKDKRISGYVEDAINLNDLLTNILANTLWTIGEIDPIFDNIYRSFESGENSNALECILKAAEIFGALIVWDTENRKISFKDISKNGKFRGLTVNYGKLLRSIKRQRTTDEMVTRLYVYGSDDLSIQSVNPTGKPYIEDFSYFMYPFERDENRNVIRSSYYMSDDLCHAILDHQELIQQYSPQIMSLTNQMLQKQQELVAEQTVLDQLNLQLENILNLLDVAKATEDEKLIAQRTAERDALQAQIDAQAQITATLKIEIDNIQAQINDIYDTIAIESNFTPELLDELNYYIIEKEWRDDSYIDPQDLYNDALKKFEEIRQPKVVIEIDIDNLLSMVEEQYYWDKLVLGDLIKIKYPQMKLEYMAKIIEIEYNFENDEINLVIANTKDLLSDTEKLVQLLYSNASASSIIQSNKHKLNKISEIESEVSRLIKSEWDATKNKIIAGVNNSIEIGKRGIIITNPDYPDEMIIIQSGVVALSKDRGETWQTAIKPDGIVAERLIGRIIAGEELIITNSAGTFTFDTNGIRVNAEAFIVESQSGNNLVEKWINTSDFVDEFKDDGIITPYEKKMIKKEWDKIVDNYNANYEKIQYFYGQNRNLQFINDYYNAYQELYNYLFIDLQGDKSLLADDNMNYSTRIDNNTFEQKFRNYYSAESELEKQLSIKSKDLADTATQIAQEAQQNINEVMDNVVYKIELTSSNGLIFRNNNINTTITARVYRGKDNITDTLPPSAFIWKKYDKDGNLDTAWTNAHAGVGNVITITEIDVQQRATFKCEINIT